MTAMDGRIILVEDDVEIGDLLSDLLRRRGFRVSLFGRTDARDLLAEIASADLLLLDLNLPDEDGLQFCRRVRAQSNIPIIMVTARNDDIDRILGLELGADDYVTKPFNSRELVARISAVLRRYDVSRTSPTDKVLAGDIVIDRVARTVATRDGHDLSLSGAEFDLLGILVDAAGTPMSREVLLDRLHGRSIAPFDRSVDVQISRLRRRFSAVGIVPDPIKTIRNVGYLFSARIEPVK